MWLTGQGAHEDRRDSSPELGLATDARGRGRGRCYGSRKGKPEAWLDAYGQGDDVCVNERGRGGQILPGDLAEDVADAAAWSELVEGDALGRPRLYGWYGEMRLGVVSVLVCLRRKEVARLG